jgi:hypothetical protein
MDRNQEVAPEAPKVATTGRADAADPTIDLLQDLLDQI